MRAFYEADGLSTEIYDARTATIIPGTVLRTDTERLTLRWSLRSEMRLLFELTGLEVVAEHGDFKGGPPAYGREQVWVLRRGG